jgi:thiamine pyrophosphate-dependent acetolactate synthase large subunit-like protein
MAGRQAFLEILRAAGVQYIIGNPGTTELPLMDVLPAYPDMQYRLTLHGGGSGWGLPATMGVALAFPDRPIVGLIGDGSAMYSIQGLWTAARYNLRTIFIICNNGQYLILKRRLHAYNGPAAKEQTYIGIDLVSPAIHFVDLARALGVHAECAERPAELHQALQAAMQRPGPTLIDVPLAADFPVA